MDKDTQLVGGVLPLDMLAAVADLVKPAAVARESYRLFEMWMNRMQESVDHSWQEKARARFAADVITAALSPADYLGTSMRYDRRYPPLGPAPGTYVYQ